MQILQITLAFLNFTVDNKIEVCLSAALMAPKKYNPRTSCNLISVYAPNAIRLHVRYPVRIASPPAGEEESINCVYIFPERAADVRESD